MKNKNRINGRVYMVTGASSGIGRKISCRLADEGAVVYGAAKELPAEYKAAKGKFIPVWIDITDSASVKAAADRILSESPTGVYGVINCAGSGLAGALEDCTPEEVLSQFNINTVGALRVTQAFMGEMRKHQEGVIINIGSIAGDFPLPYQGTYSMAKAALKNETEVIRMEMKRFGIEACVIEPGDMKTGFTAARRYSTHTKGSVHEKATRRAVYQMAHDEQNGYDPKCVADLVIRLLGKKKLPAYVAVGGAYQLLPLVNRLFPYSSIEWVLAHMYHV